MDNWEYSHDVNPIITGGSGTSSAIIYKRTFSMPELVQTEDWETELIELNKGIIIPKDKYFMLLGSYVKLQAKEFGRLIHGPTGWSAVIEIDLLDSEDNVIYNRIISDIFAFDRNDDGGTDPNYAFTNRVEDILYLPVQASTQLNISKIRYRLVCGGQDPYPSEITWFELTDSEFSVALFDKYTT